MLKNICSKNEKSRPNFKFLKSDLLFVKVCSSGDLKYNIDNQAGNFVPKVQKDLPQFPKKNRRGFFQTKNAFCLKMSTGHLLCTFDNLAVNIPTKMGIFRSQSNKTSHFSPKNLFFYKVFCWASTMQIWQSSRTFDWQLSETFLPKTRL